MKYYIKALVNFTGSKRKLIVGTIPNATDQDLTKKLMERFPATPITQLEIIKTKED